MLPKLLQAEQARDNWRVRLVWDLVLTRVLCSSNWRVWKGGLGRVLETGSLDRRRRQRERAFGELSKNGTPEAAASRTGTRQLLGQTGGGRVGRVWDKAAELAGWNGGVGRGQRTGGLDGGRRQRERAVDETRGAGRRARLSVAGREIEARWDGTSGWRAGWAS